MTGRIDVILHIGIRKLQFVLCHNVGSSRAATTLADFVFASHEELM